ncbi:hypothetical protein [Millisia brevis]|uniref:hypothetical protein n=1 Tax=Millisia brevis TaxID=264148 RepID=UPI0012EE8E10|nr:hypothetical protein [Millisia brevis]
MLGSLISGCTGDHSTRDTTPTAYEPPENVRNATMIWSAESGIDLVGPEAILVRAAREADVVARYAGPDSTYPGFMDALDPELHDFYGYESGVAAIYGTQYARLQSLDVSPDGFTALICIQGDGMARLSEGTYVSSNGPAYALMYEFVDRTLTPPERAVAYAPSSIPDTSDEPTATDRPGDQPAWSAPRNNLFTGWTITLRPLSDETNELCDPWGRTLFPDAPPEPETVENSSPPPTLPASPGWLGDS